MCLLIERPREEQRRSRLPGTRTSRASRTGDQATCKCLPRQSVIVSVVPLTVVANCRNALVAGPVITMPSVVYCDPWHGQTYRPSEKPVIVQASCVQMAVRETADV